MFKEWLLISKKEDLEVVAWINVNFSIVFIDFDISSFLWVFVLTDSQTENVYYISADITSQPENPGKGKRHAQPAQLN